MASTDNEQRGPEQPPSRDAKDLKPAQPNAPDEIGGIGDAADDPMFVHSNDEAAGEKIKEQLRKGHQQVSRMD